VALLGLTLYLAADVRRTNDAQARAQVEQLLLAGAAVATDGGVGPVDVALPAELREQGAVLSIEPADGPDGAQAVITATMDGQSAQQVVTLERAGAGWR